MRATEPVILIPSFEPTERLLEVVRGLRAAAPAAPIVVVDDGSGPAFAPLFHAARDLGADVVGYDRNRGKGFALKTGLRRIRSLFPGRGIVCADSDGQHLTVDILRVADAVVATSRAPGVGPRPLVLGGRRFAGEVPLRSRFGNAVSRRAFRMATGVSVHDTQTGLRGIPADAIDWMLGVGGDRFEYEQNVLLAAPRRGRAIVELEIETVYLDHNGSSHFRPVVDSVRVLLPVLTFALSSFASFVVDTLALQLLFLVTGSLLLSVVAARLMSAGVNFALNRGVVFRAADPRQLRRQVVRYAALAIGLLGAGYALLALLTGWGVPLLAAKVATDTLLYLASFQIQRRVVFGREAAGAATPDIGIPPELSTDPAPRSNTLSTATRMEP